MLQQMKATRQNSVTFEHLQKCPKNASDQLNNSLFCILASGESVEEILQLFGNYHQLSEILKEKANTAGKILCKFYDQVLFILKSLEWDI